MTLKSSLQQKGDSLLYGIWNLARFSKFIQKCLQSAHYASENEWAVRVEVRQKQNKPKVKSNLQNKRVAWIQNIWAGVWGTEGARLL